ncbi:hypothetical protein NDU88_004602 [Pleurodeles waltl]|uniref:glucuronosyltransferase n=1 Tax=Pleurodeles waltl TaxID=8319 RepID=A0AAV7UFU1_PLEWA|nr:hypothetical protein NDU88_004602 [Pleurodeles waltl]
MTPQGPLLLLLFYWSTAEGGKLLVVPQDGSHWLSTKAISEELGQRGNEIMVIAPEINLLIQPSKHYTLKTYPVPYTKEQLNVRYKVLGTFNFEEQSLMEQFLAGAKEYNMLMYHVNLMFHSCVSLMQNEGMIRFLEESHFDALLTDPALPCGVILADRLKLPLVQVFRGYPCSLEHKASYSPSPPSYVPICYTSHSDHMNFEERVRNFIASYLQYLVLRSFYGEYERLAEEVLHKEVYIMELIGRASIWLVRYDFVFEHPRPVMPNMVFIGGLNCKQGKKINEVGQRMKMLAGDELGAKASYGLFLLQLLAVWGLASCGQLLVVPQDGSQLLSLRPLVEKLGQRGHDVVLLLPEKEGPPDLLGHCIVKTYPAPYVPENPSRHAKLFEYQSIADQVLSRILTTVFEELEHTTSVLFAACNNLLHDRSLLEFLHQTQFDAVLTDPFFPCGPILAELLSLPAIYFVPRLPCGLDTAATHSPSPASYVPRAWTSRPDRMTFVQRLENLIESPLETLVCRRLSREYEHLASEFLQRHVRMLELLSRAAVWLLRYDFVLDYPRPVMPNMAFVGGSSCADRRPLPQVRHHAYVCLHVLKAVL